MWDIRLEWSNTAATVITKVSFIRLLLTAGRNRGLIESNPAEGMACLLCSCCGSAAAIFDRAGRVHSCCHCEYRAADPAKYSIRRLGYLARARLNPLFSLS